MKTIAHIISLASLIFTTGCAAIGAATANLPTHFDGIHVQHNIAYGAEKDQKLDIYLPPQDGKSKHDVIVFFYGGRWTTGEKEDYAFVGSTLAQAGYVVAIPDYRKYPAVRFPVFVQDAAKAVAWVADNIGAYGGDAGHLFIAGHSSGAHLGALIVADPRYLKAEGKSRSIIKAFAGLAGPYAFTPDTPDLEAMFGPPSQYAAMQVPTFIDGHQPPMLLLYGANDKTVGRVNLDKLQSAIQEKGGCVRAHIYPGIDHVWIVGALSWLGKDKAPVLKDMTTFFNSSLKEKCPDSE